MTRIAHLVPDWTNPGDQITFVGIRWLLEQAVPGAEQRCCYDHDESTWVEADVAVLAGTPWLYDLCGQSAKYRVAHRFLDRANARYRLVLGAGACYPLAWLFQPAACLHHADTNRAIGELFGRFDLVTVRDPLAHYILSQLALPATLQPCPSIYATEALGVTAPAGGRPLLVVFDPAAGLSRSDFSKAHAAHWRELTLDCVRRLDAALLAVHPADADWLPEYNGQPTRLVTCPAVRDAANHDGVLAILRAVASASRVVSGRLHAALPARALAKPTQIMAADTRAGAAVLVGAVPLHEPADLDRLPLPGCALDCSQAAQAAIHQLQVTCRDLLP